MTQREKLLTIGEFSKVTGIGIHSLRYYDEIGALKPAFVDPVSNYRYYRFDQLGIIPAINICKDAGINLGEFGKFVVDGKVDYEKLLDDSRGAINRKINEYRKRQDDLSKMELFFRYEQCIRSGESVTLHLDGFDVWTMPVSDRDSYEQHDVTSLMLRISKDAARYGCHISPVCFGFIDIAKPDSRSNFAFAYISEKRDVTENASHITLLPAGDYHIKSISGLSAESARASFSDLIEGQSSYTLLSMAAVFDEAEGPLFCAAINV